MLQDIRNKLARFHDDESGESSVLSNVMLLAVAALAVIALIAFGKKGIAKLNEWWNSDIENQSMTGN